MLHDEGRDEHFFQKRGKSTAVSYKEKKNADCYKVVIKKNQRTRLKYGDNIKVQQNLHRSTGYLPEPCLTSAKILGGAAEIHKKSFYFSLSTSARQCTARQQPHAYDLAWRAQRQRCPTNPALRH
jgi:hypothetical protein